ncbi:MAG TPA: winged helix-turn-helix domain-containing protein [Sphingomicrobium sp.]|nr:winged helix-turn-helix domain-containing protein [Sphingomicrobium sp.]
MISIGNWTFDPDTRRLCGNAGESRLSPKAAGVLQALAETPGHMWSRDALLERVWPNVIVTEEVLTHAIGELRRAFHDDPRSPALIETIHKSGYRLLRQPEGAEGVNRPGADWPAHGHNRADLTLQCYAMYLEASALFDRGHKSNTAAASERFREILALDPGFAPAHVGLAKSLTFLKTYYEPDGGTLDEPLAHCRIAKAIEPGLAQAYAVEGLIFAINGKLDVGTKQFARAMQLKSDCGETHYLFGRACFAELNIALAAPMLERSAALRPDDYHALMLAGKARQMLGDDELAKRDFAMTVARTIPYIAAFPDDTRALCADARARYHLGQKGAAYDALAKSAVNHEPCYHLACAFARAGDSRMALDLLEQVVELGWNHSRWLERDPDFLSYRGHPRFERIARSIRGRPC